MTSSVSRRFLLLSFDWTRPKDPPLSLGHASLLAHMRAHPQQRVRLDLRERSWSVNNGAFRPDDVVQYVLDNVADGVRTDIGMGAFVWNEQAVQAVSAALKQTHRFQGRILLGGPQVSYVENVADLETLYPHADVFFRGMAEQTLRRFVVDADESPVNGIHVRGVPSLGLKASEADLSALESPLLSGTIGAQRFLRWETQRGCPFKCSFCQHRASELGPKLRRTTFALDRVLAEARWLCDHKAVVRDVAVLDPTFNSGAMHLQVLDALAEGGFDGKLALQVRPEMVRPEFLDRVARLNHGGARVVLEFGVQSIHRAEFRAVDRATNLARVERTIGECHARRIEFEVSLIFGLPEQTLQSFEASVAWCRAQRVPVVRAFPLMLLRGTPLHEEREARQLVEEVCFTEEPGIDRVQLGIPHVVSSPTFSRNDWLRMREIAAQLDKHDNIINNNSTGCNEARAPNVL
jgi:radical SAM superfamily enzyme YgiQ (UPF0313 family)